MRLAQFAIAAIAFALFTGAQAQQPIVVKFSHVVTDETPKGKGAIRFKELAEAKTQGRVKVEVYPNSQLYKDREELEALQLGAVQMLAPSVSKFGPLGVRKFEVFDLPYMFADESSLERVVEGPVGTGLFKLLEPKGIVGLAYWFNGFKEFWDGLPADIRKSLSEAMRDSTQYVWDIAKKENEDALAKIKAAKTTEVYVLPPAEKAAWRKAMLPLYREHEGVVGRDTLESIEKTVAQSSAKK